MGGLLGARVREVVRLPRPDAAGKHLYLDVLEKRSGREAHSACRTGPFHQEAGGGSGEGGGGGQRNGSLTSSIITSVPFCTAGMTALLLNSVYLHFFPKARRLLFYFVFLFCFFRFFLSFKNYLNQIHLNVLKFGSNSIELFNENLAKKTNKQIIKKK